MLLAAFFVLAALAGLLGLALLHWDDVLRVLGTGAFILTLAALGVAVLR